MDSSRRLKLTAIVYAVTAPLCPLAQAKYGGGTGEPNDPYLIYTAEHLNAIGTDPNNWDKHFRLTRHISLPAYRGTNFNVIGYDRIRDRIRDCKPFTGGFDGAGYTIHNLTYYGVDDSPVGLFGYIADPNVEITNLGLVEPRIDAMAGICGALVGRLDAGTIADCYVKDGVVYGDGEAGGLVGESHGHIAGCYSTTAVIGGSRSGGLVGHNRGSITRAYTTALVRGIFDVGGLAGSNEDGTITYCRSSSSVFGMGPVGGLVGANDGGTVTNCHATGDVLGGGSVGGLLGLNTDEAGVADCYATGAVTGGSAVGGFVGKNEWDAHVTNCHAGGSVVGEEDVGGFAGYNFAGMDRCYALGNVCGQRSTGGLVGFGRDISQCYARGHICGVFHTGGLAGFAIGAVTDSYAVGSVSGEEDVGGLVGLSQAQVTNCYSVGRVTGEVQVGGLVGNGQWDEVLASCWDTETSGQLASAGGRGMTTAEMQMAATFIGWGDGTWTIDEGNDYPRLWWEQEPGGVIESGYYPTEAGTPDDPFLIHTAEQMILVGWVPSNWDKHFKLMADIDLSPYAPPVLGAIGDSWDYPFTGVFDGNGHTISNFRYQSEGRRYVGLFGHVYGPSALIENLGLVDPNVEAGSVGYVGSMVGYLGRGTIANCFVRGGSVAGGLRALGLSRGRACIVDDSAGGLAGTNGGTIADCYSTATVATGGSYSGGGLVGMNNGAVTHCYAAGAIVGRDYRTGGLTHATHPAAGVVASFWDVEASGRNESGGGIGKTTAALQTAATFYRAGWDFVHETDNGSEDIWWIDEGNDYPRLWWERGD